MYTSCKGYKVKIPSWFYFHISEKKNVTEGIHMFSRNFCRLGKTHGWIWDAQTCVRSEPMSGRLKLFSDSFGFLSLHKPLIVLQGLLCTSTCQLLTKWGYNVSLSTVNFNNLSHGPLTVSFYHIINDDSIFLCHFISSADPRPYYAPVMKCNGVVIGPHYTRSGNSRLIFLSQWAPAGDSQWETKHSPFLMRAIIQITFQLESLSPF